MKDYSSSPLHVINASLTGRAGLSLIEQTNGYELVNGCPFDQSSGRGLTI
ncbi:MAG: hypothetical protein ACXWV1_04130 [Chitinophagaceae bacterium]